MPAEIPDLVIELVFETPRPEAELRQQVALRLQGDYQVEAVFDPATDHHFFLTLLGVPTDDGLADQIFFRAREIRHALDAAEANPIMIDSLYGAAAVAPSLAPAGLCATEVNDRLPTGWVHGIIKTEAGWRSNRGKGVKVAIIDTGVSDHDELRDILAASGHLNLVEGGSDPQDRFSGGVLHNPGHGTVVASVIASRGGLDGQAASAPGAVTGVAPEAEILAIRAFVSVVNIWQKTIPRAIVHAVEQGADVIVMCMGGPTAVSATQRALRIARDAGVLTVCAAGNCWPLVVFPAGYADQDLSTAVAALQPDLMPWKHSARGAAVVISAPGEQVWAASKRSADGPRDLRRPSQGTTLATSLVAGAAALWTGAVGGRDKVRQAAAKQGMSGQELFNHVLRRSAFRPLAWGGRRDLGAGVLRISGMFVEAAGLAPGSDAPLVDAPAPDARQAPPAEPPVAVWQAVPVGQIAARALTSAEPRAEPEMDRDMADFAPELLWRAYRAGSRARAASNAAGLGLDTGAAAFAPESPPSTDLRQWLTTRPFLREMLGG